MANLPTRNQNPGDLKFVGQEGATPGDAGFAKFPTAEAGFGALLNDIQHKIKTHPDWTLADFSNAWAPPSDHNDTAQYTANLANQLKVAPNTPISQLQPKLGVFAEAIAANEGYQGDLPGVQAHMAANSPQQSADMMANMPDWTQSALGAGAGILAGVGGFLKDNLPLVGGLVGESAAGPVGGIGGALLGEGIKNIFGGGNNNQPPVAGGQAGGNPQGQNPDVMSELASLQVQPSSNAKNISDAIHQALQGTQSNRVYSGEPKGKEAIGSMGVYGYVPDIDQGGNMDFTDAFQKARKNEGHAAELEMVAAGNGKVPMLSVINYAGQQIAKNPMYTPDQRKQMADYVGEYARAYAPANGSISAHDAVRARHQQYAATKGRYGELSTTQIEARKALAAGFRAAALKNSANPELQEAAIKEQGKHINAQEVMRRLHQKKAPIQQSIFKSALYRTAARYAEIYIGDKIGGPIGAVLGLVVGEHLNRKLAKKLSKTKFDTKEMRAAFDILHETKPDVYELLIKKLEANGIKFTPQEEKGNKTAEDVEKDVRGDLGVIKGLVKPPKHNKSK